MLETKPARDSGDLDREIAELYLSRKSLSEIAGRVGLATSSCGRRLGKMFKSGEIPRKPRDSQNGVKCDKKTGGLSEEREGP